MWREKTNSDHQLPATYRLEVFSRPIGRRRPAPGRPAKQYRRTLSGDPRRWTGKAATYSNLYTRFISVTPDTFSLRKEVIQPQVLLRLPCYDFTPIMNHTLGRCPLTVGVQTSSTIHFRDVTGGVYKARERIHAIVLI